FSLAPGRRRHRDDRTADQSDEPDSARRRRRRTEGRRGIPVRRRLELHHRPDDHRRRRAGHRAMDATPGAPPPWEARSAYWVRTKLTYPGRPLADVLSITAVERPDKPATHFLGAELTYMDLKRRADALAASLARLGIAKGDRVGIMLPNCPQY